MSGLHFDSFDGWIRITEKKPVQEGWHQVLYGDWSEAIGDEENTFYEGIELFLNGEWLNEPDEFLIYYKPEVLRKYKKDE